MREIFYVNIMYKEAKVLTNTLDSMVTFSMFREATSYFCSYFLDFYYILEMEDVIRKLLLVI
jgi:hypothetical protein